MLCRMVVEPGLQDDSEFLYAAQPELLQYRTPQLTVEKAMAWYRSRAQDIEHHAGQVDCALSLVRLGMERHIPGLLTLCDDLVTLETLVYEAGCDFTLTLKDLQQMKDFEKLRLLMERCSEDNYVTSAYQWMVPFLHRCEKQSAGAANELLREYLVTLAKGDLKLPLKIFQHSKPDLQQKIIPDEDQLMAIALECIYNCERSDQLSLCYDILECLPQRGCGVSELLKNHGLEKPVSFVKNTQSSSEEARSLMVRLTRRTGRNRLENIHLAGQMMQCSACSDNLPAGVVHKGKPQYRVSYERSIDLVLAASREYFNSSTSLTDSCMDLARCCLQLITDRPAAIQEELDLIQALGYLEEFGVKILPLQVRLCSDRISLIKECVSQSPTCYKQSAKLLGLAELLRVAGEDPEERHGQVLILLVEQALNVHDYKAASTYCQELMAAGYPDSWDVCSQLGQAEGFRDLATRQELMAFALTHCPPSSIELLLAASSSLQTEDDTSLGSSSADLLQWTTATTMRVLSNTTTTTRAVLQAVSDGQWWKKSLAYLRPLQVPVESLAEVLLRTGKLAEAKAQVFPTTEVLLQLASDALPNDMTLALAYLLALPQVLDANKCFEKQAHSALSLQLAAYYYSLQIYARLAPCFRDKCHPLYRVDPKELIKMVTRHVAQHGHEAWPEDLLSLTRQLHYYNERLLDFTQAQLLQGLRKGVDVQRFTADDQYKRETILGLAETLEENVYSIALSLAQRYSISQWEVFMTHLEFLFSDSGLSTGEIEKRAQALHLFDTLKTDPESFHKHMVKYIYPTIEGLDHERLLYYFTLLESCGCADFETAAIKPEIHIRLLKKFKVVASGLNYKKLTDKSEDALEALEPVLTSQNILSISKLAPRIPEKEGQMLSPSSLYTVWLQKLFWTGDPHLIKQAPESSAEWLHAYDVCLKYFDRLGPHDLITVVDAITFSPKAVSKLSVEAREEMTRKAIKTVKHFIEKPRKRNSEEDPQEGSGSQATYADALAHLETSLAHLETLSHSFILSLKNSEQEVLQKYSYLYDLSRAEKGKLNDQAVAMCLDGQPLRMIQQLLEVAIGPVNISPKDVVHTAITQIISSLSGTGADLCGSRDPLQVLEGVVGAVRTSVDNGEELVSAEDLLQWLRPFCAEDSCPVRPRIQVLQLLGQSFHLSEEDNKLLVFFRTEAILRAAWPQRQVDVADTESEESRHSLFMELLESSHHEGVKELCLLLLHQSLLLPSLKLLLESGDETLQAMALEQISAVTKVNDSNCDQELLSLLVDARLLVKCVSTPFYPHIIAHLVANNQQGRWNAEELARHLQEAGHEAEAGSLLLAVQGTHRVFRTFSTALSALRQWV
ncbi:rCG62269, isoform CRA_a [Rattus norvegicus]|uniref:RCG62269, isoform CRA_a n=1 Tax=Rattus norvegicus TaxID=10116 RepID=A6HAR3_RAT|nr:rCG62269, isoform CRA_a [Rattus norvegicus]